MDLSESLLKQIVSPRVFERGLRYFNKGYVLECAYDKKESVWFGLVAGSDDQAYEVALDVGSEHFRAECDCPHGDYCKHIVALGLHIIRRKQAKPPSREATRRPQEPPPSTVPEWEKRLETALAAAGRPELEPPPEVGKRYPVYRLYLNSTSGISICLQEARFGVRGLGSERPLFLDYYDYEARLPNGTSPRQHRLIALIKSFPHEHTGLYTVSPDSFDVVLGLLKGYPFAFVENTQQAVRVLPQAFRGEVMMKEGEKGLELQAVYREYGGAPCPFSAGLALGQRLWLVRREPESCSFYPVNSEDDPHFLFELSRHTLTIPAGDVGRFLTAHLPRLAAKTAASLPSGLAQRIVSPRPRPVLTLEEENGDLTMTLAFAYGDGPAQHLTATTGSSEELLEVPWEDGVRYLRRDPATEAAHHARLQDLGLQSDPADGRYRLKGDAALDFLMQGLPALQTPGEGSFEIYGVEQLSGHRLVRRPPKAAVSLTSGLDWFDLELSAEYEDAETAAGTDEILTALASGRRYLRLGNGSWGKLPETFLAQKGVLEEIKEAQAQTAAGGRGKRPAGKGLRLSRPNASLAAALLDGAQVQKADASWSDFRRSLESFAGIRPAVLPASFRGELRPYQKQGFDWLSFLRDFRLGGVLADEMGLGKTIQTLALLLAEKDNGTAGTPSLLIVPKSVVFNWLEEARRFAPSLRVLALTGPGREALFARLDDYDLIVTTYATAMRDAESLANRSFRYLILDEAQSIKNPSARTAQTIKEIPAQVRLALTGTPLENNLTELWSIFDFLMPGFLGSLPRFVTRYARPAQEGDREAAARLRRRVAPFILRRLKADVLADLPPKTELVRWCELPPAQRKLYRQVLATARTKVMDEVQEKGLERSRIAILDALLKLRQVACHPQLLKLPGNRVTTAAKLDLFREVVGELLEEGHRALVFSQFVEMLTLLRRDLDRMGVPYEYLDGRTRDRQARVDRFNRQPDIPLFLISLKAGGTGLNLTGASYVIHYDPWWNPAVEAQATGRAHRIGQTKEVFSVKLLARGTVEEKILELQERKRRLAEDILGGDGGRTLDLTRDDLEELFRLG